MNPNYALEVCKRESMFRSEEVSRKTKMKKMNGVNDPHNKEMNKKEYSINTLETSFIKYSHHCTNWRSSRLKNSAI